MLLFDIKWTHSLTIKVLFSTKINEPQMMLFIKNKCDFTILND